MLVSGLVDYAHQNAIATYTGVAEQSWFEQIQTFGWNCSALGRPCRHGSKSLVALRIDIDADTIPAMSRARIYRVPPRMAAATPSRVAA